MNAIREAWALQTVLLGPFGKTAAKREFYATRTKYDNLPAPRMKQDHKLTLYIMWCWLVAYFALILSCVTPVKPSSVKDRSY